LGNADSIADNEGRRAGLKAPSNVDEISQKVEKVMVQAYNNVTKEIGSLSPSVREDVDYYQSRRIKRVFASTIGSALAENPFAK
jgi:hypothetical protein